VEATLGWAFELDVDALRLDAVKHMDHVITRTLSLTLQARSEARGGAPFWLVGETFTGDEGRDLIMSYVSESELDGQFDFPLLGAIRSTFGGDGSFRDLEAATAASEQAYGAATDLMSPFVGNHDVPRIATVIAGNDGGPWGETADLMAAGSADVIDQWEIINRMSLSYAYLLGLRGVPLLYYGDEIGLAGAIDPDNRRTMVFAPDLNANQQLLLSRVQQLGQIRAGSLALRRGLRKELWLDDVLYVFARYTDAGDVAIVAMSKATTSRTEQVTLPPELGLADGTVLNSANSSRTMTVTGGQISLTLDPWEYMVVVHPSDPSD
ncbi:MAG: glycosidase, partial [Myxococcota bacterium]